MSAPLFYLSTPIYYVNDRPHIGHCYTTIVADALARFHRFAGDDVFFLTGTGEHGEKVEKSAAARGIFPQALADENAAHFISALAYVGASQDDFIRTTEPRHTKQVQEAFRRLIKSGDVYLGTFEGWYDEGQEEYVTEIQARERNYKAFNGQPLVKANEENYYFKLSAYKDRLNAFYQQHPEFIRPEGRRNEVLGRVNGPEGLQDVPVSRTNFSWGVPVPAPDGSDSKHVTYVWIDALLNYTTALGVIDPSALPASERNRARYWPAQLHLIGKEILWFHAVIWPALLMALDLPLPGCVYAHSFWIREGRKMSKTLGNFIDLPTIEAYCNAFGRDAFRWHMLTQGPLAATDADFSHSKFIEVYNADLANGIGNAFSRVSNMVGKYFDGRCPDPKGATSHAGHDWPAIAAEHVERAIACASDLDVAGALQEGIALSGRVDGYIHATEPFKLAKDPAKMDEVGLILYNAAEALRIASLLLWPAMPAKIEDVWRRMGSTLTPPAPGAVRAEGARLQDLARWGGLKPGTPIEKGDALFPRADPVAPAPMAAVST